MNRNIAARAADGQPDRARRVESRVAARPMCLSVGPADIGILKAPTPAA